MIRLVIAFLQLARFVLREMEARRMIAEGEARQITRELVRVAQAASLASAMRAEIERLSDEEVDAALRGDFRT